MDDDSPFIPPINIPMRRLRVTYRAVFLDFLAAAQDAAGRLSEVGQPPWQIDGYKSDALFLICRFPGDGPILTQLTAEFELDFTDATVTVGIFSRWDSTLNFYRSFIWHLDTLLPRRLP